jgi:hypothetical protein
MNKKALFIGGGALAVVAIVVALILIFTGGNDQNSRIFGVTDKVNDVPDGFVYLETVTQSGTYSGLVYVGNDSSVKIQYDNNGNQAEIGKWHACILFIPSFICIILSMFTSCFTASGHFRVMPS